MHICMLIKNYFFPSTVYCSSVGEKREICICNYHLSFLRNSMNTAPAHHCKKC